MPTEKYNILISLFKIFIYNKKVLLLFAFFILIFIIYSFLKIAIHINEVKDIRKNGVETYAVSFLSTCNSKYNIRNYKYIVDEKEYYKSLGIEDGALSCDGNLGDKVKLYYLKENPNRALGEGFFYSNKRYDFRYVNEIIVTYTVFLVFGMIMVLVFNFVLLFFDDDENNKT